MKVVKERGKYRFNKIFILKRKLMKCQRKEKLKFFDYEKNKRNL